MTRSRVVPLLLTIALCLTACASDKTISTNAGSVKSATGRIAFVRFFDEEREKGELFTIEPDGTGEKRLTHPARNVDAPDWSPDGSRITYMRCDPDLPCEVWTIRSDGSDAKRLSAACAPSADCDYDNNLSPSYSPDGRSISFVKEVGPVIEKLGEGQIRSSQLYVMNADGAHQRAITHSADFSGDTGRSQWSPDGKRLVFEKAKPLYAKQTGQALFIVNIDGSGLRQLTPWSLAAGGGPDWSAKTNLILFRTERNPDFPEGNWYTIRPDGEAMTQITHFAKTVRIGSASFSPDGRWIVFGKDGTAGQADTFIMRSDGSQMRPVTRTPQFEGGADWGRAK